MAVQLPRPELECYNTAMRAPLPTVVDELRRLLGAKLVAYIAHVGETRAVRQWAEGTRAPNNDGTENRLRLAYSVALCIANADGASTAQSWFQGLNPLLDDVSPARLLREGDLDSVGPRVITAERHFLANG